MPSINPYKTLGVSKNSSQEAIKAAYYALALKHHPDRNNGNKKSEEQFKRIAHAYELISQAKPKPTQRKKPYKPDKLFYIVAAGITIDIIILINMSITFLLIISHSVSLLSQYAQYSFWGTYHEQNVYFLIGTIASLVFLLIAKNVYHLFAGHDSYYAMWQDFIKDFRTMFAPITFGIFLVFIGYSDLTMRFGAGHAGPRLSRVTHGSSHIQQNRSRPLIGGSTRKCFPSSRR